MWAVSPVPGSSLSGGSPPKFLQPLMELSSVTGSDWGEACRGGLSTRGAGRCEAGGEGCAELHGRGGYALHNCWGCPIYLDMTLRMSLGVSLVDALISLCPRPGVGRYLDLKVPFPPYASFPLFVKSGV